MRRLSFDPLLGVLTITTSATSTSYSVDPVAHDYGPAVRLYRLWPFGQADAFGVTVATIDRIVAACGCGALACDHADAIASLIASGRL